MLCKGSLPRNTRFFSLAMQLMRMRYQAVDDNCVTMLGRSDYSVVFKCRNISDVNIE